MTQSIGGFFSGGAKGITWPDEPPASVTGTIEAVHPPEEILDPKDDKPTGKYQIRIMLATDLRDPAIEDDDGRRTLYVKSWMRGAVGDALRKAGEKEPRVGARLTVTFTHTEAPDRPGLSKSKHYVAEYVPAANAAAGQFLNSGEPAATNGTAGPQRPASIPEAAWAAMDPVTKAVVAAAATPPAPAGPQRPASITEAAWEAMTPDIQAAVAKSLGGMAPVGSEGPPF